jgi:hypothetical protein
MRRLVLVLAACGSSEPAPVPKAQSADAAPAQHWVECVEASRAKLEATLMARHHLERSEAPIDGVRCLTIVVDKKPAFYVELVGTDDRAAHRKLRGIVALDGTTELVALHDAQLDWAQLEGGQASFEAVDLDGDGTDELLVHRTDDRHALDQWIDVVKLRERALVAMRGPRVAYDNSGFEPDELETCSGRVDVDRGALVLTTVASTGKGEHCRPIGRHVFSVNGDKLVEQ